jgi:hypothetical protein
VEILLGKRISDPTIETNYLWMPFYALALAYCGEVNECERLKDKLGKIFPESFTNG